MADKPGDRDPEGAAKGALEPTIATLAAPAEVAAMALPARVRDLAETCGFEVHGWHEVDASVVVQTPRDLTQLGHRDPATANRPVVDYIGSRDEAIAFMTAWSQCVGHKVAELLRDEHTNEKVRRTLIPLGTDVEIVPGQSAQITARPQRGAFRGDRVAIPRAIAERFDICDLKVGNVSTFEVSGDIPAVAFAINVEDQAPWFDLSDRGSDLTIMMSRAAKEQFGRAWSMPVTQTAMDLTIVVRNKSKEPAPFCALILGRSANYW